MSAATTDPTAQILVRRFLEDVRSGRHPDDAYRYMAEHVLAHQLTSEHETTIRRTPDEYADHVREMLATHGNFTLDIITFVAADNLVAVTWRQIGQQNPTKSGSRGPVNELGACTYRLDNGRIVEYWLLVDRLGIERQLESGVTEGVVEHE